MEERPAYLNDRSRYVLLLPAVLVVLFLSVFPLLISVFTSLSKIKFVKGGFEITYVGLKNYEKLLQGSGQRRFLGTVCRPHHRWVDGHGGVLCPDDLLAVPLYQRPTAETIWRAHARAHDRHRRRTPVADGQDVERTRTTRHAGSDADLCVRRSGGPICVGVVPRAAGHSELARKTFLSCRVLTADDDDARGYWFLVPYADRYADRPDRPGVGSRWAIQLLVGE